MPIFVCERVTDGIGIIGLAAIGLILYHLGWELLLILLVFGLISIIPIQSRPLAQGVLSHCKQLPSLGWAAHSMYVFLRKCFYGGEGAWRTRLFRLCTLWFGLFIGVGALLVFRFVHHVEMPVEQEGDREELPGEEHILLPVGDFAELVNSGEKIIMKTLIIIPTYNEIGNIRSLLEGVFSYAPETNILIVDDNSPDGTGKLADEISEQNAQVSVMHRSGKLGLGTAYIAGFKYAIANGYDAAFEMDADFSHDPKYLPDFLKAIEHADLVIGSRYIKGGSTPNWSLLRRIISGGGNIYTRFVLGISVHDCTAGFRCYRREVLEHLDLDTVQAQGYAFQVEMAYRVFKLGYRIVETPITFMDRRIGQSKMSGNIFLEGFTSVLRMRFSKSSTVVKPQHREAPVASSVEAEPSVVQK